MWLCPERAGLWCSYTRPTCFVDVAREPALERLSTRLRGVQLRTSPRQDCRSAEATCGAGCRVPPGRPSTPGVLAEPAAREVGVPVSMRPPWECPAAKGGDDGSVYWRMQSYCTLGNPVANRCCGELDHPEGAGGAFWVALAAALRQVGFRTRAGAALDVRLPGAAPSAPPPLMGTGRRACDALASR